MMKKATNAMIKTTTAAAPTPIPALAPVLRLPEDELDVVVVGADVESVPDEVAEVDAVPLDVSLEIDCVDTANPA